MSSGPEQVMARAGRTFHLAARLLPAAMRAEAATLYAFCRRMDDLADDGAEGPRATEQAGELLARAIRAMEEDPLGDEAASYGWPVELEARYPHISQVALRLTRALAADAMPCRILTEEALLAYAFGVAGTVGIMMCRILGAPPEAASAAADLGIAMQLTNIARDVREDFERDRIYLPSEWVAQQAVAAALRSGSGAALEGATRRLLRLADRFYTSADAGMPYLPWRARLAILAARSCYREIGVVVERDIPGSWRRRAVVSRRRKAQLVWESARRVRSYRRLEGSALPATAGPGSHG